MFKSDQYELLDFGSGEKLETFNGTTVRRQTPSVDLATRQSYEVNWQSDVRFRRNQDRGKWSGSSPGDWAVKHGDKRFLLRQTPAGQVGVFPEQAANWEWIEKCPHDLEGMRALNLFGYTGGTTMSLASRGAHVVHVDSAANVMKWARENAAASNMVEMPIRWIVEDALKFVKREAMRGSKYDIIVADPPSFGRGPKKETWKFEDDISELLRELASISQSSLTMFLLSCHTVGFDPNELKRIVSNCIRVGSGKSEAFWLRLEAAEGKALESGSCFRFCRNEE
jgi:23S rRNA (cytosine1962-C5)-methyltransferase